MKSKILNIRKLMTTLSFMILLLALNVNAIEWNAWSYNGTTNSSTVIAKFVSGGQILTVSDGNILNVRTQGTSSTSTQYLYNTTTPLIWTDNQFTYQIRFRYCNLSSTWGAVCGAGLNQNCLYSKNLEIGNYQLEITDTLVCKAGSCPTVNWTHGHDLNNSCSPYEIWTIASNNTVTAHLYVDGDYKFTFTKGFAPTYQHSLNTYYNQNAGNKWSAWDIDYIWISNQSLNASCSSDADCSGNPLGEYCINSTCQSCNFNLSLTRTGENSIYITYNESVLGVTWTDKIYRSVNSQSVHIWNNTYFYDIDIVTADYYDTDAPNTSYYCYQFESFDGSNNRLGVSCMACSTGLDYEPDWCSADVYVYDAVTSLPLNDSDVCFINTDGVYLCWNTYEYYCGCGYGDANFVSTSLACGYYTIRVTKSGYIPQYKAMYLPPTNYAETHYIYLEPLVYNSKINVNVLTTNGTDYIGVDNATVYLKDCECYGCDLTEHSLTWCIENGYCTCLSIATNYTNSSGFAQFIGNYTELEYKVIYAVDECCESGYADVIFDGYNVTTGLYDYHATLLMIPSVTDIDLGFFVYDAETLTPLSAVDVTAFMPNGLTIERSTDANGFANVTDGSGTYYVTFGKTGYITRHDTFANVYFSTNKTIYMISTAFNVFNISGYVQGNIVGNVSALANAFVSVSCKVYGYYGDVVYEQNNLTVTSSSGYYEFRNLRENSYCELKFRKTGFNDTNIQIPLLNENKSVNVTMYYSGLRHSIIGYLIECDNETIISFALVTLEYCGESECGDNDTYAKVLKQTNGDGYFVYENLYTGFFRLCFNKTGYEYTCYKFYLDEDYSDDFFMCAELPMYWLRGKVEQHINYSESSPTIPVFAHLTITNEYGEIVAELDTISSGNDLGYFEVKLVQGVYDIRAWITESIYATKEDVLLNRNYAKGELLIVLASQQITSYQDNLNWLIANLWSVVPFLAFFVVLRFMIEAMYK